MFKLYWNKFLNILRYQVFLFLSFLLSTKKVNHKPYTLLIIRLDSIGDYILFRNFLKPLKESRRFGNYSITLIGNILWKDLAETFDKDLVGKFIWIERDKFYNNPFYKYNILKRIRESGFEIVIDPTYSRELLFGDTIVKASGAKERIGSSGSPDKHTMWRRKLLTDKYYTDLVDTSEQNIFEFNRNKEFFEKVLGRNINLVSPFLDVPAGVNENKIKNKFIVIFPGAADEERRWPVKYFAEVSDYISSEFGYEIIIAGSAKEKKSALEMISFMNNNSIQDSTGELSLPGLAELISGSVFLLTNETGAAHIAASIGKTFICISNGNHFGRFNPYPEEVFDKACYVYPPEIMNHPDDYELFSKKFRFSSDLNINKVKPGTVKEVIRRVLNN
jgi:ADP-heptose:LPS heptosyltransferase